MESRAQFSTCRTYRYVLWRRWDLKKPQVAFIGLNPSTADECVNDPTIRRCIGFARQWNFGGLAMVNLFAFRSTQPKLLKAHPHPIGAENDAWILKTVEASSLAIICWGNHGSFLNRDLAVLGMTSNPYCFGINRSGQPSHPLYRPYSVEPFPYPGHNNC